jgi:Family of unknown function (DUF6001)
MPNVAGSLHDLIGQSETAFAKRRVEQTVAALERCGTSMASVRSLFADEASEARHLLVTSSVSQGLANVNSDIDVIGITDNSTPAVKMAVQKFVGRTHYEIIMFSLNEWHRSLAGLERAAESPLSEMLEAARTWNKTYPVALKYLERVVNGVDLGGTMPYLDALPALSVFWKFRSFEVARKSVLCALLAERTGETRGRLGYAINALLDMMNAILSHHGRVFSNRKWYLLRWRSFARAGDCPPAFATVAGAIDTLFDMVSAACRDPRMCLDLGPFLVPLYQSVRDGLGIRVCEESLIQTVGTREGAFLPGFDYHRGGSGGALLAANGTVPASLADSASLDPESAGSLLRGIRAGVYRIVSTE